MFGGATFTLGAIQYFIWAGTSGWYVRLHTGTFGGHQLTTSHTVFSGLRAFALSRNLLLGSLAFLLSVVPFVLNLVSGTLSWSPVRDVVTRSILQGAVPLRS